MAATTERSTREPRIDPFAPARDATALLTDPVFWGWGVPRGDGHTVITLPGLGGGDVYLGTIRQWLRRVGYRTARSGIERNRGWSREVVQDIIALAESEAKATGRPVSLIGHSMGGVIAISAARRAPTAIRQVVTLGSPLVGVRGELPSSVSLTALYSKADPIVRYPAGLARLSGAENIEVSGSHTGLATNREVYRHLGRILAAPRPEPRYV